MASAFDSLAPASTVASSAFDTLTPASAPGSAPPPPRKTKVAPLPYETPPDKRPSVLRDAGELFAAPMSLLNAAVDSIPSAIGGVGRPPSDYTAPGSSVSARMFGPTHLERAVSILMTKGPEALNREYDRFSDADLRRQGIDPAKLPAWKKAVGEFAVQWFNPLNKPVGKATELVGGKVIVPAFKYLRDTYPAADAAAATAGATAAKATEGLRSTAINAAARIPGKIGNAVQSAVDRYAAAGLPQRGGSRYVAAAMAAQSAPEHAAAKVTNDVRKQFDGLTTAQKVEVQRLSYMHPDGTRMATRNPAVPQPKKGPTLEARADWARSQIAATSAALAQRKILPEAEAFAPNMWWPMQKYPLNVAEDARKPVYLERETTTLPEEEQSIPTQTRRGAGGHKSTIRAGGHKQHATILGQEDALHPDYDPAFQLEQALSERYRAIANEDAKRGLEDLPSVDPKTGYQRTTRAPGFDDRPSFARMPLRYFLDDNGRPLIFGEGQAGNRSMENYIKRVVKGEAQKKARLDPRVVAFAKAHGVDPAELGSRNITARVIAPFRARLNEAQRSARIIKLAQDKLGQKVGLVGQNVGRASERLDDALKQNLAAVTRARTEASNAAEGAELYRADAAEMAQRVREAPTRKQVTELARQLNEAERSGIGAVEDPYFNALRRTVVPPLIFRPKYPGGPLVAKPTDWAEDWENTPGLKQFLAPRSTWPKTPIGQSFDHPGNFDELPTYVEEHGGPPSLSSQEVVEWMQAHPFKYRVDTAGNLQAAREFITEEMKNATAARLEEMGFGGMTPKQAVTRLNKIVKDLEAQADTSGREVEARTTAERELGPPARGSVAAGQRAAKRIEELTSAGVSKGVAQHVSDLEQSYAKQIAKTATAKQFAKVTQEHYASIFETVAKQIRNEAPHAPEGYVRESTLGMGSPSGVEMALDDSFAKFYTEGGGTLPINPKELNDAKALWHAFQVLNRLARMSIVLVPTVHGVNNLGMHAMAEGVSPVRVAQIVAGKAEWPQAVKDRAYAAGAASDTSRQMFSSGDGFHTTTAIPERAQRIADKAGPFAKAVRPLAEAGLHAGKVYNGMNKWLFGTVEQGYAFELFDKFTREGMSDGDAAIRVRNALGRFDNISPAEKKYQLNALFYFYSWMKTVIPFWAKKGVVDPKWWVAPERAIQVNNQTPGGYDDPSQPFTATLGKRSDGTYRRYNALIPQRVVEPLAELGRAPIDAVTGHPKEAVEDLKAPGNYLTGHFNVLAQVLKDAQAAWGDPTKTPPYNVFHVDPHKTNRQNQIDLAGRVAGRFISPVERIEGIRQDPFGAIAGFLTGGSSYGATPAAAKKHERDVRAQVGSTYHWRIKRAKDDGDDAEVERLTAEREAKIQARLHPQVAPLPRPSAGGGSAFDNISPGAGSAFDSLAR